MLNFVEDIKQNITDNQYKTIMESLMEMNKFKNKNINTNSPVFKCIALINWSDSKLELILLITDILKKLIYKNILSQISIMIITIKILILLKKIRIFF